MARRDKTMVAGAASITKVENWLQVSEDTRRKLMEAWGLSSRSPLPWSELLARIGLDPEQPLQLHEDLMENLWDTKAVAFHISKKPKTVASWVATGNYPKRFPRPVLIIGPRKKLWLPIEVKAYYRPNMFLALADAIHRPNARPEEIQRHREDLPVTLEPLDG